MTADLLRYGLFQLQALPTARRWMGQIAEAIHRRTLREIKSLPEVTQVYVRGSFARGTAVPLVSDLDLMILLAEANSQSILRLSQALSRARKLNPFLRDAWQLTLDHSQLALADQNWFCFEDYYTWRSEEQRWNTAPCSGMELAYFGILQSLLSAKTFTNNTRTSWYPAPQKKWDFYLSRAEFWWAKRAQQIDSEAWIRFERSLGRGQASSSPSSLYNRLFLLCDHVCDEPSTNRIEVHTEPQTHRDTQEFPQAVRDRVRSIYRKGNLTFYVLGNTMDAPVLEQRIRSLPKHAFEIHSASSFALRSVWFSTQLVYGSPVAVTIPEKYLKLQGVRDALYLVSETVRWVAADDPVPHLRYLFWKACELAFFFETGQIAGSPEGLLKAKREGRLPCSIERLVAQTHREVSKASWLKLALKAVKLCCRSCSTQ